MPLNLDYYYGNEAEQYSFYRIPKVLLTDPNYKSVSIEAKVLYGLLLDRMSLSVRNGWMDAERRVYIYFTQEDAMQMMDCGHNKAVKLFADLEKIGMIERKKQGLGRPMRIYVKNFILPPPPGQAPGPDTPQLPGDGQTSALGKSVPAQEVLTSEKGKSALPQTGGLDFPKGDANKTDKNKTELSYTDPSTPLPPTRTSPPAGAHRRMRIDEMDGYQEQIKENIDYDLLLQEHPWDGDEIDGYVELMAEACASRREHFRIGGEDVPAEMVRRRLLKLSKDHLSYVMECLRTNTTQVGNIKAYTLAALYNAPVTIGPYYSAQVGHDMAQGLWGR